MAAALREYRATVDSRWMFPSSVKEDCPITPCAVRKRLQLILEHAGCRHVRFHDLRHTFATLSLQTGMDVKTLSAILGHVSAATTLDIYTHITAICVNLRPPASTGASIKWSHSRKIRRSPPAQSEKPRMADFKPYRGSMRKPGTGSAKSITICSRGGTRRCGWTEKKHARNVYAYTREECEAKLKVLIICGNPQVTIR